MSKTISRSILLVLSITIPPLIALYHLLGLYVDLFFWDEWNMLARFSLRTITEQDFPWAILWEEHFSHRAVVLKLLSAMNFHAFAGNQLSMLLFSWTGQVVLLYLMVLRVRGADDGRTWGALLVTMCVSAMLFSPSMALTWVWPICLAQVLTSSLYCVAMIGIPRMTSVSRVLLIAVVSIFCTFSMGNGLMVWPAALLLGAFLKIPIRLLVIYAAVSIVTISVYFHDLTSAHGQVPSSLSVFDQLVYGIAFIGSPMSRNDVSTAVVWGCAGIMVYSLLWTVALCHWNRSLFVDLSFGWLTLGSALAGAFYRIGEIGPEQALVARYVPLILPFWLSVLVGGFRATQFVSVPVRTLLLTVFVVIAVTTGHSYVDSGPIDPAAFDGARHSFVRVAYEGLQEGVVVSDDRNPYINLFADPNGALITIVGLRRNSVGMFRSQPRRRLTLGKHVQELGTVCTSCDTVGSIDTLGSPYIGIEICANGLTAGVIAGGQVAMESSRVQDVSPLKVGFSGLAKFAKPLSGLDINVFVKEDEECCAERFWIGSSTKLRCA